ncbi:hypothetical protein [Actinoallomurus soli]|uniref:hypothetical protein n=1 Tax=Actinoallomurus soli TaxID=2952535 RepID=UPI0020936A71|nr:hypothetical protein [Actinoallomurus soli]MCO5968784.1 hypothetical protein [Actinoallomurus soli]
MDDGPAYPWPGNKPWPGTENIKDDFAKNHKDRVKDGWYIDAEGVSVIRQRLQRRRDELDSEVRKALDAAGAAEQVAYGTFMSTTGLHSNVSYAHGLMTQALQNVLEGFDKVLERLSHTQTTANNVEIDNVSVVYKNIKTVDVPKDLTENGPPPGSDQGTKPGQQTNPGQQTKPGSYS